MPVPFIHVIKQHRKHRLESFVEQQLSWYPCWLEISWGPIDAAMTQEPGQNLPVAHVDQRRDATHCDCMHGSNSMILDLIDGAHWFYDAVAEEGR